MREATSARAALMLKALGVANVRALTDGWAGWLTNHNRVAKGPQPGK